MNRKQRNPSSKNRHDPNAPPNTTKKMIVNPMIELLVISVASDIGNPNFPSHVSLYRYFCAGDTVTSYPLYSHALRTVLQKWFRDCI